jgi:hypothetical protein
MTPTPAAPWHLATYETFITSTLPDLLASRVPLDGYSVERVDDYHCKVELSLKMNRHNLIKLGIPAVFFYRMKKSSPK